jgi:site-specific recombinase XerD
MPYKCNNYWYFSYYDKVTKKSKSVCTKLPATQANKKLATEREKTYKETVKIETTHIEENKDTLIGTLDLYKSVMSIANNTYKSYRLACEHFIKANGNLPINCFTDRHYMAYIQYLKQQEKSKNSIAIMTRSLHVIFQFAMKKKIIAENIVEITKSEGKEIEIIPTEDLEIIHQVLLERITNKKTNTVNKTYNNHYYFIRFLEMSGFRISSAVMLNWEDVDFVNKIIKCNNVKGKREELFPLTKNIEILLDEFGIKKTGKVFGFARADSTRFFKRIITQLLKEKKITKAYTFHQFRKTAITNWVNKGISIFDVKTLAMHTDIKTTMKYYAKIELGKLRDKLDNI